MNKFTFTTRRGAHAGRWDAKHLRAMNIIAVRIALDSSELVQVWRCAENGDLLSYDSERTRRLSDRIVKARAARSARAEVGA